MHGVARYRAAVVGFLAVLLVGSAVGAVAAPAAQDEGADNPCVGTVTEPAEGTTVVSVQGMRFGSEGGKRPARLVGVGPRGGVEWVFEPDDVVWGYDVDPLADGTLFVTATTREDGEGKTVFYRFDPETGAVIWSEVADFLDTHDADLLDEHRILVANMRATDGVEGNRDRLLVYNRTTDEITWEWRFSEHYPRDVGGNYSEDWTHVNDVDRIDEHRYLASPRNFDQVIVVNRTSGEIELRLGEDDRYRTLNEQHNPAYYESDAGRPTILVADSDNDRIVEYERRDGDWIRTWRLGSGDAFDWPRDADRLPNGNTLVADSRHDRVIEVTPEGEVVWEFYAPWLVYDVERVVHGDEPEGPTIADQNATGVARVQGDTRLPPERRAECAAYLRNVSAPAGNDTATDDGADGEDEAGIAGETTEPSGGVGSVLGAPVATLALLVAVAAVVARRNPGQSS